MKNILSLFALLFLINSYNQVDVLPSEVISKYIQATGVKEKLESIESIMMLGNFEIPQAPFKPSVIIKQQNPNKTSLDTTRKFSDYTDVDGILYPFKTEIINGMQTITIEFEEIKFNESFAESDFN